MGRADLPAVMAIQRACYGEAFMESAELFERRLAAAPHTGWVMSDALSQVGAYLSAYPSQLHALTALHGDFAPAGARADTLYLHDLAVHPQAHGQGLGPRLVQHALAQGADCGWPHAALVSVQGSQPFWQRLGFVVTALKDAPQQELLRGYATDAVYMVRSTG